MERAGKSSSVLSLTVDSQRGAGMLICADEQDALITIAAADRDELERLVRDRHTARKVVWRARIVLCAEGLPAGAIAAATGKSQLTVRRWRRRFLAKGVLGAVEGRQPSAAPQAADGGEDRRGGSHDASHQAAERDPLERSAPLAAAVGLSTSSIQRIWSAHGLKPHLAKTFKLSRDPNFAARGRDASPARRQPTRASEHDQPSIHDCASGPAQGRPVARAAHLHIARGRSRPAATPGSRNVRHSNRHGQDRCDTSWP